jgi:hypothetical protein
MRRTAVRILALALLLAGVGLVCGQPTPPPGKDEKPAKDKEPAAKEKSKLEEWLAQALKSNPDIRVAEAKQREAEAEWNRTRLLVMKKVTAHYHAWLAQKAAVQQAEANWNRISRLAKSAVISQEEVDKAQAELASAKAKLAEIEAELPYLIGKAPATFGKDEAKFSEDGLRLESFSLTEDRVHYLKALQYLNDLASTTATKPMQGPMADRIRKALDTPVTVDYKGKPEGEVLEDLLKKMDDVPYRLTIAFHKENVMDMQSKVQLPLGAALQMWQDYALFGPNVRFVVRDYGILVTGSGALPPDTVLLHDFWKSGKEKPKLDGNPPKTTNPPPDNVEGTVKTVDASGLVKVSIGSDAGLAKGHTLEVFRLSMNPSKSKYLGTIRIIDVSATEAVGKPEGRLAGPIQEGDTVASQIRGN